MTDIAFDIETIPNSSMQDRMPEPEVKTGNLKDPFKIAEKIAEAKAEQAARMTLNPLWGRVCAFVGRTDDDTRIADCIHEDSDAEESRIIERILPEVFAEKRVITYNGNSFDIPFVYRRAVLLGIDSRQFGAPPLSEMVARYNNKRHIDVMQVWCGYDRTNYEKLNNIARALLGDQKIEIDFRKFPELIKTEAGRNQILEYCDQDVLLLLKTWFRIVGILI